MQAPITPIKNLKLFATDKFGKNYPLELTYHSDRLVARFKKEDMRSDNAYYLLKDFTRTKSGESGYYILPRTTNMRGEIQTFFKERPDGEYYYTAPLNDRTREENKYKNYINTRPVFSSFIVKNERINAYIRVPRDYNYGFYIAVKNNEYVLAPYLDFTDTDVSKPYKDLEIEIYFFDKSASYADVANLEREIKITREKVLTVKEKCAKYPAVEYARKYPLIRIRMGWKPSPSPVLHQTVETEPEMFVACTFKRVRDIIDELKKQGVAGAELQLVGWNVSGHDGRFPDLLPADERLGGTEELKKTIAYAKQNGYTVSLHTNNIDSYEIAKSFSWKNVVVDKYKSYLQIGHYSGGLAYHVCPEKQLENAKKLLPKIAELKPNGVHFIDVVSIVPPDPCYSKSHPSNNVTGIKNLQELIEYACELFGGFSSEGCFDFALKNLCYALYTSFGNGFYSDPIPFQDRVLPFYELIIHGLVLYNPLSPTINYVIKTPADKLDFIMRGGKPSMYFYSKFRTGGETNWMGNDDLTCNGEKDLTVSVKNIKSALDEYAPLAENQLYFMTNYEFITETLNKTTFSNGVEIIGNYSAAPAVYNGKTIEPFKYIVVKK